MVKFVESELEMLKKEILDMCQLVSKQMELACDAILTLNKEEAQLVIMREKRVNAFELKIDSDVEDIIALYNPVAIDLRFVLAMLKINTNLERIGDFAESMGRFVVNYPSDKLNDELIKELRLNEMMTEVQSMLFNVQDALIKEKSDLAICVFQQDNTVDEIDKAVLQIIANHIEKHPEELRTCLPLANVFRKLERSGDHINNIAEEIIFYLDAKVLKHNKTAKMTPEED